MPTKKKAEEKQEWLVMGRARGKLQAAASQSPEALKSKDTNSPIPKTQANYAETLHMCCKKYDPGLKNLRRSRS